MTLRVASLHRYPVKSMLGESVDAAHLGSGGIGGDRSFALLEQETGLVASAKNHASGDGCCAAAGQSKPTA